MPSKSTDVETLARKILFHSRRRITHISPILLESIYALPERIRITPGPLSTDGCSLCFNPEQVVEDFREDKDDVARQLAHVTAHCLLGHLDLRGGFQDSKIFDISADLKAAQFVEALCGYDFAVTGESDGHSSFQHYTHLRPLCDSLLNSRSRRDWMLQHSKSAHFDDHDLWTPPPPQQISADSADGGTPNGQNSAFAAEARQGAGSKPDWQRIRQSMLDGNGGKLPGNSAGFLMENFSVPDRGLSYSEFLKRFASPEERMLLDPDSFDMRWYHLGLEYYGDIPLLEPSELSEPPLPSDIVIALDTSGSCSGEVCSRFLKETLGILRDISAGASRFRVLLLQCDTRIQSEVLLESPQQVEELFQNFSAQGFGGTDFRPVFQRIEELRQSGALPRIRGLLYLSDGCGDFPNKPTDYPTVFLIPEEDRGYWSHEADWITRLYLNENDFTLKEANTQ